MTGVAFLVAVIFIFALLFLHDWLTHRRQRRAIRAMRERRLRNIRQGRWP